MKGLLISKYGLEIITPAEADRNLVHNVIYEELCLGAIREDSRKTILRIIENMQKNGAEGIILGCTELPLLIKAEHTGLPLFDTTLIHARRAVVEALA